ncbi:MAG: TatD family hydrolase, partial [Nitrospirota bacterium]
MHNKKSAVSNQQPNASDNPPIPPLEKGGEGGFERGVKDGLIDTHCHLEMDEFNSDREEVIKRAKDVGIEAIITIGSDLEGNIGGLELSEKYDFIYSAVGIHPHDAKDFTEDIYNQLKAWANPPPPPFSKGGWGGFE